MAETVLRRLRALNRWVAIAIGVMLLACALFVLLDIVLRQLGSSFGGTDEISGYVMALATSWGMAYALLELGHVRIDIVRSRLHQPWRAGMDVFSLAVLSVTVTLIALRCWPVVEGSFVNGSRANTPLETPLLLVQAPWFAGWVWFAGTAWIALIAAAFLVARRRFEAADAAVGTVLEGEGPA